MGLFDSLLKAGVRAVTSKAVDAAVDAVMDAVKGDGQSGSSKTTFTQSTEDNRSFDEKMNAVLENLGGYELRKNISPDTLEQEAGTMPFRMCFSEQTIIPILAQKGADLRHLMKKSDFKGIFII